jgi:hypothetical protein
MHLQPSTAHQTALDGSSSTSSCSMSYVKGRAARFTMLQHVEHAPSQVTVAATLTERHRATRLLGGPSPTNINSHATTIVCIRSSLQGLSAVVRSCSSWPTEPSSPVCLPKLSIEIFDVEGSFGTRNRQRHWERQACVDCCMHRTQLSIV